MQLQSTQNIWDLFIDLNQSYVVTELTKQIAKLIVEAEM